MLQALIEVVRWVFISLCTGAYVLIAYLASLDFRGGHGAILPGGVFDLTSSVVRHVVLIPGLVPLVAVIVWARRARSWQVFVVGGALVVCVLAYHYILFAVSAHSDAAYPWFQAVEFLLLWFVLRYLRRTRAETA